MREKLLQKLKRDVENTSIVFMADKTGVPYSTLWRLYKEKFKGNVKTWDALEKYYYPNRAA